MLTQKQTLEIFEATGALLRGHFSLRSGLHSDRFLQSAVVLQYPELARQLCAELATELEEAIDGAVDLVMGPAIGGVILAHELARDFSCRAIFGEKTAEGMSLRPGFELKPADRVVIVDDVLTTGSSVFKLIELSKLYSAELVATAFLIDRSSKPIEFGVPKFSLAKISIPTYSPDNCPMCKAGTPLIEP